MLNFFLLLLSHILLKFLPPDCTFTLNAIFYFDYWLVIRGLLDDLIVRHFHFPQILLETLVFPQTDL